MDKTSTAHLKGDDRLIIRTAEEKDLPNVLRLYAQPDMDNGQVFALPDAKIIYNRMKSYPDNKLYVAELDGEIVGTYALAIMDNLAHMGRKSGLIEDVIVSQEYRRLGIGREMMRYAIETCKEKSCYKVMLSSNLKRENAHSFYDSIGFKKHGYSFLMELE